MYGGGIWNGKEDYLNGDNAKYDDDYKDQPVLTDNSVNND